MKQTFIALLLIILKPLYSIAQAGHPPPICGRWVNTQYEHFKMQGMPETFLFRISPWFLHIDSSGRCTVELLFERKSELGLPVSKSETSDGWEYQYKKAHNTLIYSIRGNDSFIVYSTGSMKGWGIIFKKYK